jgi:hypothetical protein
MLKPNYLLNYPENEHPVAMHMQAFTLILLALSPGQKMEILYMMHTKDAHAHQVTKYLSTSKVVVSQCTCAYCII